MSRSAAADLVVVEALLSGVTRGVADVVAPAWVVPLAVDELARLGAVTFAGSFGGFAAAVAVDFAGGPFGTKVQSWKVVSPVRRAKGRMESGR